MRDGFAIAIAWPETLCKQPGSWYDVPMRWIGINKDRYYKVGHAAVVLIHSQTRRCYYFDFGRYHSPFQHGRVRDAETDHELKIKTKAILNEKKGILNLQQILSEVYANPSCHGTGVLHAAYCKIEFSRALVRAKHMQQAGTIAYGPFKWNGTNCCRFVKEVLLAGRPELTQQLLLRFPKTVLTTPLGNVAALDNPVKIGYSPRQRKFYLTPYVLTNAN